MRTLGLTVLLILGVVVACSPVTRDFKPIGGTGGGGATSSGSNPTTGGGGSGGSGGQGGSAPMCQHDSDCASDSTTCGPRSCVGKFCRVDFAAVRSSCTEHGGQFCDGKGKCVTCIDASDCPPSPTLCQITSCGADGTCGVKNAKDGTTCSDMGGHVCSSGACVACNGNGDCGANNVCQNHACIGACSDGMKDGSETDKDCGGGSCPACPVGDSCGQNNDCVAGSECQSMVCTQCVGNYQAACGSCNGVIDCAGNCTIATPANLGQSCGSCGGTILCSGSCSVRDPANLGDECTTTIHCPCGYALDGEIDCQGKCAPTDSCSCCGHLPC